LLSAFVMTLMLNPGPLFVNIKALYGGRVIYKVALKRSHNEAAANFCYIFISSRRAFYSFGYGRIQRARPLIHIQGVLEGGS